MKTLLLFTHLIFSANPQPGIDYSQKQTIHAHTQTKALTNGDIQIACTNTTTDSPGCTCAEVNTKGYSRIWLDIFYTKGNASRVDLEVFTGPNGTAWATMQSSSTATLPALLMETHDPYWDTSSTSGTVAWGTGFDVVAPFMRFCFYGASANSSDLVNLYIYKF